MNGRCGTRHLALDEAFRHWEHATLEDVLARHPERSDTFSTASEESVKRLYTPLDVSGEHSERLGFPGECSFPRGIHRTMYRGRLWTMRMLAGFGSAEEANARFKCLLEEGQTGFSVAFDLHTLMGYDADAPEAEGEFGKCGVAVSSLRDIGILFDSIPLERVTTSMTLNAPAPVIWAMLIAAAEREGVMMDQLGGTIQNDILKEYIA